MRILFCHRPGGAFGYITDGMINALRDRGHEVQRWDDQEVSWYNFDPELYVGASGHKQNIPKNHKARLAIHVNPCGPVEIKGINESQETINWVLKQKPNCVFGYGFEQDRLLWSGWEQRGIPWVPMPTGGDSVIYKRLSNARTNDVVYLGGYWPYKGITINSFLLPALKGVQFKLHGWGDWPSGYSKGILPDESVCEFFNSGRIGPCMSEQHTQMHGIDVPERAFKLILCGVLAIHDPVPSLLQHIPSLVVAQSASDYRDLVHYYVKHPEIALARQEKQYAEVVASHTYHHRLATLFRALGEDDLATQMLT